MRWDLLESPEFQNWLQHRDQYDMTSEARRFWPFWSSGRSTHAFISYFQRVQEEFGAVPPQIATITQWNERVEELGGAVGGGRTLSQSKIDCKRIGLWEEVGDYIQFTTLGEHFFNRVIERNLQFDGELRGNLRPRISPQQRLLEEARCFELLEAGCDIQDSVYGRYYHTYCLIREYLPANPLPSIEENDTYDEDGQLADFFHLLHWLNLSIGGYNPFEALVRALEESGEEIEDLSIQSRYLIDNIGFNIHESNFMSNSWRDFRSRSVPMLMWIHAMDRMASGGVAPPSIEVEGEIGGEHVEHIPVLGVGVIFNQNTTDLLPDGMQLNPINPEPPADQQPNAVEPRPGDIYFVIRFVRDGNPIPRLFPLVKVGAAWPNQNNPDAPPSLLREANARIETNFPLLDAEGRPIEHQTVARYVCADTRSLEGSTGLRGHLDAQGYHITRMRITRQRENVLLFGELNQDMSHITNEQRAAHLEQALLAMRNHPQNDHWNNIERFEIVRPELLSEFGINWEDEEDFAPWFN